VTLKEKTPGYWNPVLETLPFEKLKELQLRSSEESWHGPMTARNFTGSSTRMRGLSPGYQILQGCGEGSEGGKGHDERHSEKGSLPLRRCPLRAPGGGHGVSTDKRDTGLPVYQPDTWQDWEWWAEAWAYILYAQGYRRTDRVFLPFGYNIFVAFWAGHYAAEKVGCEVVPGGVLDTEARILKIQELRATAMMATPTYVLGMADTARKKLGIDPAKDLLVRKITCAGEPGASILSTKSRMEEAWGAKVYDHVGATENRRVGLRMHGTTRRDTRQ